MSDPLGTGLATKAAGEVLGRLGLPAIGEVGGDHPALGWRRAGLMAMTGEPDGAGLVCPMPLTAAADGVLAALAALAPGASLPASGAGLLGERGRLMGLRRRGAISANGSARLLAAQGGTVALNLPRPDDWDLAGALVGEEGLAGWDDLAPRLAEMPVAEVLERAAWLGLAAAGADEAAVGPPEPFEITGRASRRSGSGRAPLVVDLSALWAGPLAASLLGAVGADVIKVESSGRPDGARAGHAGFYRLLNAGKREAVFDFADPQGRAALRDLVRGADIVIEGSRPRALRDLGIVAEEEAARGAVWLSITGHGRSGPAAARIGFGDDAAVAGGITAAMRAAWGRCLFAGDAIGDPLAGLLAAFAGWALWSAGEGALVSVPLAGAVRWAGSLGTADAGTSREWQALAEAARAPLYPLRSIP